MKGRRKEKKKGFTLIELLAVIVILAIIALIATPMILGVIEKSRKSAFQDSVYSIFEAVDYYKIENEIGSLPREGISVQELNIKNKDQFISGVIREENKKIVIENISNGIYCGNGMRENLTINKGKCEEEVIGTDAKYFTFDETTGTITAYSNEGPKDVIIPNKINGVAVTSIGNLVFYDKQLTSVTIPNSITSIGNYAFKNNQLMSVVIPDSVTSIGIGSFTNNQLTDTQAFIYNRNSDGSEDKTNLNSYGGAKRDHVIIPNSVISIGIGSFDNSQLTSITIPNSVTSISDRAFTSNQLTSVTVPNSVTIIGNGAFSSNQLTSITFPNSITSIGRYAFSINKLTSVTIPSSVANIEDQAFFSNQLTSVKIIGKASSSDFTTYGTKIWGFASGYSDANITWNASA